MSHNFEVSFRLGLEAMMSRLGLGRFGPHSSSGTITVTSRAGEPELGAPEPSIFLGVGAGAVVWICCGAGAGAINETISSGSEWLKILTKPSLQFLAQKDHLVC